MWVHDTFCVMIIDVLPKRYMMVTEIYCLKLRQVLQFHSTIIDSLDITLSWVLDLKSGWRIVVTHEQPSGVQSQRKATIKIQGNYRACYT